MIAPTPGYRLKVERAKRHIGELAAEIQTFRAKDPYSIFTEDNHAAQQRFWKVRVRECVPEGWSAIVGDAVHNVRASLDLLAVAVVRHCDPNRVSYNHVHFIVGETREKFETRLPENIKGASPEAARIFHDLKPYKGGDDAFWRLHQLDILDKHKAIIPVGAAYKSVGMKLRFIASEAERATLSPGLLEGMERANAVMPMLRLKPADKLFPLKDGATVFAAGLGQELPFDDELKFTFNIAFGEGQIFDGEPITPALSQMCEFVEGVFDVFERAILHR